MNKQYVEHFPSFASWLSACQRPVVVAGGNARSRGAERTSFTWTPSFEAALELGRVGWSEGYRRAQELYKGLWTSIGDRVLRPEPQFDLSGEEVDVGRMLSGEPECMVNFPFNERDSTGGLVDITVNFVASAGVAASAYFQRGAAVCVLADALEQAGKRVSITAVCSLAPRNAYDRNNSSEFVEVHVKVKEPDQPLDTDLLVFAIAHPSMLRRLFFAYMEAMPQPHVASDYGVGYSYGQCRDIRDPKGLYLPQMYLYDAKWDSQAETKKWVEARLKEQGVELSA